MDQQLLAMVVCPSCHGKLILHTQQQAGHSTQGMYCVVENLYYPIQSGIPVLITAEAQTLSMDQVFPV